MVSEILHLPTIREMLDIGFGDRNNPQMTQERDGICCATSPTAERATTGPRPNPVRPEST